MSDESAKTQKVRSKKFIDKYLSGVVIDIGGGDDPVTSTAEVFDIKDGDAQYIAKYRDLESYDCVHSSHCLEHMTNVILALKEWWSLVKPGGFMIIVVPHEDLYEQKIWPPIFNPDHKATFRINKIETWSPVSYDLLEIISNLPNSSIIELEIHDLNYDYSIQFRKINKTVARAHRYLHSTVGFKRIVAAVMYRILAWIFKHIKNSNDKVLDQTRGNALAQIQVVIKKK